MIAGIVALVVTAAFCFAVLSQNRSLIRQQARERELLLNQIMHLSGRTWSPPPAEKWEPPVKIVDPDRYVSSTSTISENF